MSERHDIWQIVDTMQMDIRALSVKMVELRAQLAAVDLPAPPRVTCPVCGVPKRGARTLAEHMYQLHDGPLPEHYTAAAALMDEWPEAEPDVDAVT